MNSRKRTALALAPFELVAVLGILASEFIKYGVACIEEAVAALDEWACRLDGHEDEE